MEEILVEDNKIPSEQVEEKALPATKKEEPKKEEVKEVAKEEKPAEKPETANNSIAPSDVKKQSVFITGTGKTRKVTFKYYGDAKKVAIVSGFTNRQPKALTKKDGVWETTLVLYPGDYKYIYIVDNVETLDPNAPAENGRSVLKVR